MSIENNLASIAASLVTIAEALKNGTTHQTAAPVAVPAPVAPAPAVAPAPVFTAPAPAPVAAPAPAPQVVMPPLPGNVPAAPIPAAPVTVTPVAPSVQATPVAASPSDCPITDQPSLIAYVMTSYKEMGPVKGNQIQGVLAAMGITNINEAKPEQYAAIHAGVEALKAQ